MIKTIFLCIMLTFFGALGGYYFKRAAIKSTGILKMALNPYLYVGVLFYIIGAILNIIALRELKYTVVLPLTSITYVWTITISYVLLKEKMSWRKITGVGLIIMGALLLSAVK